VGDAEWGAHPDYGQRSIGDLRPSREQTYMDTLEVWRKRSTCVRGKVAACLVRDRRIISIGYNGALPGQPHCLDLGCDVDVNVHDAGCTRTIHAEQNAVVFAARSGIATESSTMYCTHSCCASCAAIVVSAGIVEFVYAREYRLTEGKELLIEAGVKVRKFDE